MLTGCIRSTVLSKPNIPANLIQPCDKLNTLDDGAGKSIMLWAIDTVGKYNECEARHAALVKALE
ncbi:hypothetical protein LF296_12590 [Acinetobacter vivianii]|uniref:Uncharacterized protein n=1 Tax=Acinetobacter vivianii TaxID=1776742 RepID=A0AAJ6P716_9GAMM|nr:hypothetical protein [Acinetobacter vivianii]WDZ53035.1 hypothetical protein LF296_12590 [Acinetobacter vivianii]